MKALKDLRGELAASADPATAAGLHRFFKTGPGEYGEGDRFLGIRVPRLRALVPRARHLPLDAVLELLRSPWHEERLLALLLLVDRYERGDDDQRSTIHRAYSANTRFVNNWDLVDSSAAQIVGAHLDPADLGLLRRLATSESVWERRIAILSTFHWIKRGVFAPTLAVATLLLDDAHDLIHKAVGWMLREVGKRDEATLEAFLRAHHPRVRQRRTLLRYAIEHFPEERRQAYLRGAI